MPQGHDTLPPRSVPERLNGAVPSRSFMSPAFARRAVATAEQLTSHGLETVGSIGQFAFHKWFSDATLVLPAQFAALIAEGTGSWPGVNPRAAECAGAVIALCTHSELKGGDSMDPKQPNQNPTPNQPQKPGQEPQRNPGQQPQRDPQQTPDSQQPRR